LSIDTLYRSVSSFVNNASASIIYDIPVDNQTATETRRVGSHGRTGTPPAESRLPGNVAGHPDTKHPYLISCLSILPARSCPRRKFPFPFPGHYRLHFILYIVDTRGRPRYPILCERKKFVTAEMPFLGMRFSECWHVLELITVFSPFSIVDGDEDKENIRRGVVGADDAGGRQKLLRTVRSGE